MAVIPETGETVVRQGAAELPPLTDGQKTALGFALPASLALAAMAFTEMFTAVNRAMMPVAGRLAWTIPIGSDVGMVAFSLLDMLFESLDMRARWMPWVPRLLICLQLSLNIASADNLKGRIGRSILPVVFVGVIEAWRWFYRRRKNLAKKSERDRIPLARYRADWKGSRELRRLMVLWDIVDLHAALDLLQQIQLAEATLRRIHGPGWRENVDADLMLKLRMQVYASEAFEAIRKLDAEKKADEKKAERAKGDKVNDRLPNNADDATNPAGGGCCELHRRADTRQKIPLDEALAKQLNAEHIAVHGNPASAQKWRDIFTLGGAGSRELRDRLAVSSPIGTGPVRSTTGPVRSGPAGQSGSVGQSGPVGSANGHLVATGGGTG